MIGNITVTPKLFALSIARRYTNEPAILVLTTIDGINGPTAPSTVHLYTTPEPFPWFALANNVTKSYWFTVNTVSPIKFGLSVPFTIASTNNDKREVYSTLNVTEQTLGVPLLSLFLTVTS